MDKSEKKTEKTTEKTEKLLENLPLTDLHCHLDGSITLDIAKKLIKDQEEQGIKLDLPPFKDDKELQKLISVPPTCRSLNDFLKCFDFPGRLLQTTIGITQAVYYLQEFMLEKGAEYLEIRFAPQFHLSRGLTQEQVIYAALDGLKKSKLHTNLILCIMRLEGNEKANLETIEIAKKFLVKDKGVVALDIAGAEALFPIDNYKKEFELAKKYEIPFTIHAGEAAGPESVIKSIDLGAKRIGHGVRSAKDKKLVDRLVKEGITLEFCPSSNLITRAVEDVKEIPAQEFIKKGVKITLNTDDLAIVGTDIRKEYEFAIKHFKFGKEELRQCVRNAIDSAFCDEKTKKKLYEKLAKY